MSGVKAVIEQTEQIIERMIFYVKKNQIKKTRFYLQEW